VHPGETPASYGIRGVLQKLLDEDDKQSQLLRSLFVFKIVPMINPDGVYRGHFRMDGFGNN
jgi:murein tripeptide amidase MpaA